MLQQIIFKRGLESELMREPLHDGLLSFTTDSKKIFLDYVDNENRIQRMNFYNGKLKIGDKIFDGSQDVEISTFDGSMIPVIDGALVEEEE